MHDVFVSYSSKDKTIADLVVSAFEEQGITCWIAPRDMRGGFDWDLSIPSAITTCRCFLLIFSGSSDASRWVRKEVNLALDEAKPIIPLRIEEIKPNHLRMLLAGIHWVEAAPAPAEEHIQKLAAAVRAALNSDGGSSELYAAESIPATNTLGTSTVADLLIFHPIDDPCIQITPDSLIIKGPSGYRIPIAWICGLKAGEDSPRLKALQNSQELSAGRGFVAVIGALIGYMAPAVSGAAWYWSLLMITSIIMFVMMLAEYVSGAKRMDRAELRYLQIDFRVDATQTSAPSCLKIGGNKVELTRWVNRLQALTGLHLDRGTDFTAPSGKVWSDWYYDPAAGD